MKYTIEANVELEGREDLVKTLTKYVAGMLEAALKAGMNPQDVLGKKLSKTWSLDWRKFANAAERAAAVRAIIERYSTGELQAFAAIALSIAANGLINKYSNDFAMATMSSAARVISESEPGEIASAAQPTGAQKDEPAVPAKAYEWVAAYMNQIGDAGNGFDDDFYSVQVRGSWEIVFSAHIEYNQFGAWESYCERVLGSDEWKEFVLSAVGEDGGVQLEQLKRIEYVIIVNGDIEHPQGVADTRERAQFVRDWFAKQGKQALVVKLADLA